MASSRHTIVVAGIPRSGSTWVFNATRMLLERKHEVVHAVWVADYDRGNTANAHLVKVHSPEELDFEADVVFTTWRPLEACIASAVRMGWIGTDHASLRRQYDLLKQLYDYWSPRSSYEIRYSDIEVAPAKPISGIAEIIGAHPTPHEVEDIAMSLASMRGPDSGPYDPKSLLHPRHRQSADNGPISEHEVRRRLLED